ncbi:MAG: hypothetical protein HYY06_23675 [Deltaproteobacteria bacterium]|nr:hypothetical protein [Deltaproteobacteria bacterium]
MLTSPFDHEHADAWTSDLVDVESLNSLATSALLDAIDLVRDEAAGGPDVLFARSYLVLGPAGSGKTHLFARLRRRCGTRAAFVLLRPEIAAEPSPRLVLAACMDALQRKAIGSSDRQIDLVVGAMHALVTGPGLRFAKASLDDLRGAGVADREVLVGAALEWFEEAFPEVELGWLERFLRLPFLAPADRRAALAWLSGREPDAGQLERLRLKEPLPEASVLPALRTLAILAAHTTPIVLVFDQLENLVDDDGGTGRIHAHARLVCELHDTVRGLVLVQMALDAEWDRRIGPALSDSEKSRLQARLLPLELPTPDQRAALRDAWVARLSDAERRPMPWPFAAGEWEAWRTDRGVTPRMLMIACREALTRSGEVGDRREAPPDEVDDRLEELWLGCLAAARAEMERAESDGRGLDAERLASGLCVAFRLLPGVQVRTPGGRGHGLRLETGAGALSVFVVQEAHWRSAAATLERAAQATRSGPVLAVREAARSFPPTWRKVSTCLESFRLQPGAHWLELAPAEVARLVGLKELLASARSQDLAGRDGRPIPEEVVRSWASRALGIEDWSSVAAALGRALPEPERPPRSVPSPSPRPVPAGVALEVLGALRLASVDRVVREARRRDPELTRRKVVDELRGLGARVRWFGSAIVWLSEGT